jgi:FG-GAP-like repeat
MPSGLAAIHGTVLFPTSLNLTTTLPNPVAIAVADIDGDGWSDVVATANNPEKVVWYRNLGDGTFSTVQYIVTTSPPSAAFSNVAVADLNLDGRPDVIYWSGAIIKWSPNLGGANPVAQFGYNAGAETANQFTVSVTSTPETLVGAADLNGDNRPDVLSITSTQPGIVDNSVAWVPNLATGFGSRIVVSTAGGSPTSVQGADLDKDGWNDLLVTSAADNSVAWFRNLGGGNFGAAPGNRRIISNSLMTAQTAAVGDLNGDGWPDVVTAGVGTGTVRWHAHNGSATSPAISTTPVTLTVNVSGAFVLAVRDMNSDGWLDVVIVAAGANKIIWCENQGGGNFGAATTNQKLIASGPRTPISMGAFDFDQNGTVDVVVNENAGASVKAYRNHGGQAALATVDSAPATLQECRRDDVLRVAVSHRGIAGDSAVQLGELKLRLETSAGAPLTTAQANALLDKVAVHLDADGSGIFDPALDPAVATVTQLTVTDGVLTFPFTGSVPASIQVAPGATRTYFVVIKMAAAATAQAPTAVRVTHRSLGPGSTVLRDAGSAAALTTELAGNTNVTSALVTATPQSHTYLDWSYLSFDDAGVPGTLPLQSQWPDAIPNVLKYGLAIDGLSASAPAGLPVMLRQAGAKIFRHRKPALAGDLTYQYDISRTLGTWQAAVENVDFVKQDTVLPGGEVQRDLTILGPWQRSFLRVRIVLAN